MFEDRLVASGLEGSSLAGANLVDGLVELGDDVETIQDVEGAAGASSDDVEVGSPHVAGNELDEGGACVAEHVEEAVQRFLGTLLADPEQAARTAIDLVDDGQELTALPDADLIDADGADAVEAAMAQAVFDHPMDRSIHHRPRRAEDRGDFAPRQSARPTRQEQPVDVAATVLA